MIILRPTSLDDAAAFAALYAANRDALARTGPLRDDAFFTEAHQRDRLAAQAEARAADAGHAYAIVEDGALAGAITLTNVVRGPMQSANVGYWVDAPRNGRGVATAAVEAVCRLAFDDLGLHRLEAGTLPDNAASQRVLAKCGFERIGLARRYLFLGGAWCDHVLFQRIADDDGARVAPQLTRS